MTYEVTELPEMTQSEWDAYCAELAAVNKRKFEEREAARQARKREVLAMLNSR